MTPRIAKYGAPLLAALVAGLAVATLGQSSTAHTAGVTPMLTVVRQVGSYEPLYASGSTIWAVYASAAGATRNQLYRSSDEGVTWQPAAALPNQVYTLSPLHTGTLIAATDSSTRLWRSADQGQTFQPTQIEDPVHPGTYLSALPQTPYRFQTLENQSIGDDGTYAYLAAYTAPLAGQAYSETANVAYLWRSADDGRTWQVMPGATTTTHKHLHGVVARPGGPVYLLFGDKGSTDGVYVSNDQGATLAPLCTGRPLDNYCINVAATLTADGGSLVTSTDAPSGGNAIVSLNLATGVPSVLLTMPYEAFTAETLPDGAQLLGGVYEPAGGIKWGDPNLHLYAVVNGVATQVWSYPIRSSSVWEYLDVKGVLANGDAVVYVSGLGTVIAHLNDGIAPPVTTTVAAPPTTTAPAACPTP